MVRLLQLGNLRIVRVPSRWQYIAEAEGADILIEPVTRSHSGHDFDAIDEMIEVGRRATEQELPMIKEAFHAMLTAGRS